MMEFRATLAERLFSPAGRTSGRRREAINVRQEGLDEEIPVGSASD